MVLKGSKLELYTEIQVVWKMLQLIMFLFRIFIAKDRQQPEIFEDVMEWSLVFYGMPYSVRITNQYYTIREEDIEGLV